MSKVKLKAPCCKRMVPIYELYHNGAAIKKCSACRQQSAIEAAIVKLQKKS